MMSNRSTVVKTSRRRRRLRPAVANCGILQSAFEALEPRLALAVIPVNVGDRMLIGTAILSGIEYSAGFTKPATSSSGDLGVELWRSDYTPLGTYRLKDINPGAASSDPQDLVVVGNTLFFTADDGIHGRELWKTDGTTAGTVMVKDINRNGEMILGAETFSTESSNPGDLTNCNGVLFFIADNGWDGEALWKSDGTAAGTVLVKDIRPGDQERFGHLANFGGKLIFSADDGVHGEELWKSDGTADGTVLVKDINPGVNGSDPGLSAGNDVSDFVVANGLVFFAANNGSRSGVWASDGSPAGTRRITPTDWSSALPTWLTAVGNAVFFVNWRAGGNEAIEELWKSDGTAAGTSMVRRFAAQSNRDVDLGSLANVNGSLVFSLYDTSPSDCSKSLWRSDGTAGGTLMLADLGRIQTKDSIGDDVLDYSVVNNGVLYTSDTGGLATLAIVDSDSRFSTLWKTDGTLAGTARVSTAFSAVGKPLFSVSFSSLRNGTFYQDGPLTGIAWGVKKGEGYFFQFLPPRATPDVNGDGRADVISRDTATGQVVAEIRGREGALKETRVLGTEPLPLAINGSFETPVAGDRKIVTYDANQSIGKWRVLEGDVQVKGSGYWQHAAGNQSLDLNGSQRGGIYQDVATTPGATYDLSLRLAGNPEGGPTIKTADIYWGPAGSQTLLKQVTFDTTGRSNAAMGWIPVNLPDLKATGGSTRLTIVSRTAGEFGPVVDDVQLVPGGAANRTFVAAADVTGDGVADLIWRRPSTGAHTVWVMALNGTVVSKNTLSSNANLALVATGDYDADSREDLIWRNTTTGGNTMWAMGEGLSSVKTNLGTGGAWQIVAADPRFDANDDGKTDLIWRNTTTNATSLWLMNGPRAASVLAIANGTTNDAPVGTGDFNGDGFGDVLWRSASTGKVTQQLMRNGLVVSSASIGGSLDDTVIWTGDVNGDRRTDIVWNKRSTGANSTWVMNGSIRLATWAALGNATNRFLIRRPGA